MPSQPSNHWEVRNVGLKSQNTIGGPHLTHHPPCLYLPTGECNLTASPTTAPSMTASSKHHSPSSADDICKEVPITIISDPCVLHTQLTPVGVTAVPTLSSPSELCHHLLTFKNSYSGINLHPHHCITFNRNHNWSSYTSQCHRHNLLL